MDTTIVDQKKNLKKYISTCTVDRAKSLVRHWATYRYGVFEEEGYAKSTHFPYFYRHQNGYDALAACNNTEIKGQLVR